MNAKLDLVTRKLPKYDMKLDRMYCSKHCLNAYWLFLYASNSKGRESEREEQLLRAIITIGNKDNSKTYTVYITHIGVRASTQNVLHQASIKVVACIYNIAKT